MGRIATSQLADLAEIAAQRRSARRRQRRWRHSPLSRRRFGCQVTAVDLTEEYCETSRWLNQLVGLDDQISVHQGDVTDLPFAEPASRGDEPTRPDERDRQDPPLRRSPSGAATTGAASPSGTSPPAPGRARLPLPWADQPALSHLRPPTGCSRVESAGFAVVHWNDMTEEAVTSWTPSFRLPPAPGIARVRRELRRERQQPRAWSGERTAPSHPRRRASGRLSGVGRADAVDLHQARSGSQDRGLQRGLHCRELGVERSIKLADPNQGDEDARQ